MTRPPLALLALLATVLAVPILLTSSASPAHACSCALRDTETFATTAEAVFVATMLDPLEEGMTGTVEAAASVERVYSGDVARDVVIVTGAQSSACGLTGLAAGDRLLFFATGAGATFQVGSCDGSRTADTAAVSEVETVLGQGREPTDPVVTGDEAGQVDDTGPGWLESEATYVAVLGAGVLVAGGVVWLRRRRTARGTP